MARSEYAGVLSILRYNSRLYIASALVLAGIAALLWVHLLPRIGEFALVAAAPVTLFWAVSSLVASYYVYDYVAVTRWQWIPGALLFPPRHWLNIHAGLDQSSEVLATLYPESRFKVVDIYDPLEMTEPSIAVARRTSQSAASVGRLDALPVPDRHHDTLFLLFAAHEIRQPSARSAFFREAARVLDDSGQLLLVEHTRDWKNFIAFGPGFLHFFSRAEWLRVARDAGLKVVRERSVTPLVTCFLMNKSGA